MPIFTAARVLSIRHDVRARSSTERLRGVAAKGAAAGRRRGRHRRAAHAAGLRARRSSWSTPRPACRSPRASRPSGSTKPHKERLKAALRGRCGAGAGGGGAGLATISAIELWLALVTVVGSPRPGYASSGLVGALPNARIERTLGHEIGILRGRLGHEFRLQRRFEAAARAGAKIPARALSLRRGPRILEGPEPYDKALWTDIAGMGWTGAAIPEDTGVRGSAISACASLPRSWGRRWRRCRSRPRFISPAEAIMAGGSEAQKKAWLPKLASARRRHARPGGRARQGRCPQAAHHVPQRRTYRRETPRT